MRLVCPCTLAVALVSVWFSAPPSYGQSDPGTDQVMATVGDEKIVASQIEHEFHLRFSNRDIGEELGQKLRARILEQLVNQHLILARFSDTDVLATQDEINLEVGRLKYRLEQLEKTLEEFLAARKQSEYGLRFNIKWQISWKRYLDKTLTEKVLSNYFDRKRTQFDGTRVRAAHILWKLSDETDESVSSVVESASDVRDQLEDGSLTWSEAASKYSTAPSADTDGDVGWLNYEGPMSRTFTDAVISLEEGEISQPIRTPFGVHLIKCMEVEPGVASWYDVRDQVRAAATRELFTIVADRERKETEVRITDDAPRAK